MSQRSRQFQAEFPGYRSLGAWRETPKTRSGWRLKRGHAPTARNVNHADSHAQRGEIFDVEKDSGDRYIIFHQLGMTSAYLQSRTNDARLGVPIE
jgi:hypothetical protein